MSFGAVEAAYQIPTLAFQFGWQLGAYSAGER